MQLISEQHDRAGTEALFAGVISLSENSRHVTASADGLEKESLRADLGGSAPGLDILLSRPIKGEAGRP